MTTLSTTQVVTNFISVHSYTIHSPKPLNGLYSNVVRAFFLAWRAHWESIQKYDWVYYPDTHIKQVFIYFYHLIIYFYVCFLHYPFQFLWDTISMIFDQPFGESAMTRVLDLYSSLQRTPTLQYYRQNHHAKLHLYRYCPSLSSSDQWVSDSWLFYK